MRYLTLISIILAFLTFSEHSFAQPDGLYDKALYYYKKGNFKKAEKLLRQYTSKRPEPSAYYLLGYALYELKRFDEAERFFQEAYLIDPDYSPKEINFKRASP